MSLGGDIVTEFSRVLLLLERGGIPYGNPNLMSQDGFLETLTEWIIFSPLPQLSHPKREFLTPEGELLGEAAPLTLVSIVGQIHIYARTLVLIGISEWLTIPMNGLRRPLCYSRTSRIGNPLSEMA